MSSDKVKEVEVVIKEGVVATEKAKNLLSEAVDVEKMKELVSPEMMEKALEFAVVYSLKFLSAIAIFIIGKWIARKVVNVVGKVMEKGKVEKTLVIFTKNVLFGITVAFVAIAALSQLGIETTSLAALIAAAGLAIGLSLQGSLSNLAAGVMIILFRPFKVGDYIEAAGVSGTVESISIFTTILKTPDNKEIIIPNNGITSDNITNYSAKKHRRVDFVFGVGYSDDLKLTRKTIESVIAKYDDIILDQEGREPLIAVSNLGDSSVDFTVRVWAETSNYWKIKFAITEDIKITFDEAGISIPFPQRDIHVFNENMNEAKKVA